MRNPAAPESLELSSVIPILKERKVHLNTLNDSPIFLIQQGVVVQARLGTQIYFTLYKAHAVFILLSMNTQLWVLIY